MNDIADSTHEASSVRVLCRPCHAVRATRRASGLQTRFSGDDDDDDYSPEPFVGVGSVFFAVNGVLPWGP
jgi:hypothetical protein